MRLTDDEVLRIEGAVRGPRGRDLMELMRRLSTFRGPEDTAPAVLAEARALGWTDARDAPTPLGWLVANPLRELLLWEERGGRMHMQAEFPVLRDGTFLGKRVLEVGCGTGCNLLTLEPMASAVLGVELEPLFLQLTPLIADLAGRPVPARTEGRAEALPSDDAAWDVALVMGALQYMDIPRVLRELARVLAPGGTAIMVLSDLAGATGELLRIAPTLSPRGLARELVLYAGNVTYPLVGRAFQPAGAPVYPPQAAFRRWFRQAGLTWDPRSRRHGHEMCYVATR